MLNASEMQLVRHFAERACALHGETDETGETTGARRVQVTIGSKQSTARAFGQAIPLRPDTDPDALAGELAAALLLARDDEGAGRAYLLVYSHGETRPIQALTTRVDLEPDGHAASGGPSLVDASARDLAQPHLFGGAVAAAMLGTNQMLAGQCRELLATVLRMGEELAEARAGWVLARTVGDANAAEERNAAMVNALHAAAEAIGPAMKAAGPVVGVAVADYFHARAARERGSTEPPTDPAERTQHHLTRAQAEASALMAHVQAHPGTLTADQADELRTGLRMLLAGLDMMHPPRKAAAA